MPTLMIQLTVVLVIAAVLALLARRLRQPLTIAYIVTGIVVGPMVLGLVHAGDAIDSFGQIGVALLLFLVGLGIKPEMIREVGPISLVTGIGQIIITSIFGFGLATLFGFPTLTALYIAVGFTFSSTIVILQLLYTKDEQDTLYGRIAIGFMLVQDIVAMAIFLFLASFTPGTTISIFIAQLLLKAALIVLAVYVLGAYIVPRFDKHFAREQQALFLFSLAVCFLFVTGFGALNFSFELGALLAGVVLSSSPYQRQIASKVQTLRDFFLIMFFIVLGTHVTIETLASNWAWVLAFSAFILLVNPLIVLLIMRHYGYTLRTSFHAGLTVAQVSEFSLILLATGVTLGHVDESIVGPATLVALITILGSSYFIMQNNNIFHRIEKYIRPLFGSDPVADEGVVPEKADVLLFGCHRLGSGLIDVLEQQKRKFLVIDHNPDIVQMLHSANVEHAFGSADDISFLDTLPLKNAKLIISTIPEFEVNLALIHNIRHKNKDSIILCVAYHAGNAEQLYKAGATYIIMPPYLGRLYLRDILRVNALNHKAYEKERTEHRKDIVYRELFS